MTPAELDRLAHHVNLDRPDWQLASLRTWIAANLAGRPYLDALHAFLDCAADPATKTPARVLEAANYLVIDRDTSELLVRSFIRHDELLKQPNMATAMGKAFYLIESLTVRSAVLHELRRLYAEEPEASGWKNTNGKGLAATHPELLTLVQREPFAKPFAKPFDEPLREGAA
jgi:hypothetical protein